LTAVLMGRKESQIKEIDQQLAEERRKAESHLAELVRASFLLAKR
jgi:hypothetical protein